MCSCSCGSCLCCLFPCFHAMCHHRSARPVSLNGHREQESQSRVRNHVLAALDSPHLGPPRTPSRLRTRSDQHYLLPLRMIQECRSQTDHGGSSQTLLPGTFPGQLLLPSHPALRLDTVADWRKSRRNRCTRGHLLLKRSLLTKALARSCLCCSPWIKNDTTSDVCAWLVQHVPAEVVNIGSETL